jgi:hypothetical protein
MSPNTSEVMIAKILAIRRTIVLVSSSLCRAGSLGHSHITPNEAAQRITKTAIEPTISFNFCIPVWNGRRLHSATPRTEQSILHRAALETLHDYQRLIFGKGVRFGPLTDIALLHTNAYLKRKINWRTEC